MVIISKVLIEPSAAAGDAAVTLDYVSAVLSQNSGGDEFGAVKAIEGSGVCGNGICETGESCSSGSSDGCCFVDCPVVAKPCPTPQGTDQQCGGNGICLGISGTCECFAGQVRKARVFRKARLACS